MAKVSAATAVLLPLCVVAVLAALAAAAPAETGTAVSAGALSRSLPFNSSTGSRNASSRNAAPASAAPAASSSSLITHNNQSLFLTGWNIGNVQLLPFRDNPYGYSTQQMRALLSSAFADMAANGANSVRLWLHIDGSRTPAWGKQGNHTVVMGLPAGLIADLQWLLRTAYGEHGLLVCISLWSHDILAVRRLNGVDNRARAVHMMTDQAATAAYIDNALLPLIAALRAPMSLPAAVTAAAGGANTAAAATTATYLDAVVAWDVLNEPEGVSRHWRLYKNYMYTMSFGPYSWWNPNTFQVLRQRSVNASLNGTGGSYVGWHFLQDDGTFNNFAYHDIIDNYPSEWDFLKAAIVDARTLTTVEVPYQLVLRFVNRVAGAIHRAAPGAKVTIGVHSTPYALDPVVPTPNLQYDHAPRNYYSDELLVSLGGDPQGTLDFLSIHQYPIWNEPERDQHINLFMHPKAHWRISKPVLIGEHWEQVLANPSTVTVADYMHLHNAGYAGGWGWAYFNVTEQYNLTTGAATRSIGEHKCRGTLRALYAALPQRLRYRVSTKPSVVQQPTPQAGAAPGYPAAVVGRR